MASIRKRGKVFHVQVRRTGYESQTATFKTRKEADEWARSIESRIDAGVAPSSRELRGKTVEDLFDRFLTEVSPKRKSHVTDKSMITRLKDGAEFMRRRLDQPIADSINDWFVKRSKLVSAESVNREMNLVSGVFQHAIKVWRVPLPANPAHSVHRPSVSTKSKAQLWTPDALQRLRAAAAGAEGRMALVLPAVELGIETAMRRSELCSIVAGNVHMERSFVHLENTKNGDDRDVPLSARAIEILTPLLAAAQGREDDRLFPMAPETLTVYFSRLREAAGLGSIRIHDARHTAATNASKVFTNVLELSAFTGHRSLQTLKKYYHPDATDLAARLPGAGAQLPGDPA